MKTKILFLVLILCFMSSACSSYSNRIVYNNMNTNCKSAIMENSLYNSKQNRISESITWNILERRYEDINNDRKEDEIILMSYEDMDSIKHYKIKINDSEKILEFDPGRTIAVNSINIKQFVKLEGDTKGILLKINSEGETSNLKSEGASAWWFDHSFIIVSYVNGDIATILDGINMPFNNESNYIIKHSGDYNIEFIDTATKFSAIYEASIYKNTEDGEDRLKLINNYKTSGISNNYYNINVQDLNSDGIDEIISSKYIPGLYHADLLGIIDYTFIYKKGKYYLSKEALKYDGEQGLYIVKEEDIQME